MYKRQLFDGDHRVNPRLVQLARDEARQMRDDSRRPRGRSGRGRRRVAYGSGQFGGGASGEYVARHSRRGSPTPSRSAVVVALQRAGLLPAICFVFSRSGCDAAVRQLVRSGIRLTSREEVVGSVRCV